MEIIEVNQNTTSWLEGRKKIIGASEVPIILGLSPFSTPYQLWQYKTSTEKEVKKDNGFIFEKGHRLEDVARAKLEFLLGYELPPLVVKHKEIEYMQSSLDGCDLKRKKQVEIKYMGKDAWEDLRDNGTVPKHYMPQVQYQLMTTGFEYSYFCGINDTNQIAYTTVRPDSEMIELIVKETMKFYYENMLKKLPPELIDLDVIEISDNKLLNSLSELRLVETELKSLTNKKKALRAVIEPMITKPRMSCEYASITKSVNKKGTTSFRYTFKKVSK